ncbi:MAG: GNAT family N-acetyltransferase [Micromonosporaceae bacterium]
MLRGQKVVLRARTRADMEVLYTEILGDPVVGMRVSGDPWVPVRVEKRLAAFDGEPPENSDVTTVSFAVDTVGDDQDKPMELAGFATLWGIDTHNRRAHLGMSLRPAARGKRLASDVVRVLCHYAFGIRGLNRVQVDTLADNIPMRRAAESAGFVEEGVLRSNAWVDGAFEDEVVLSMIAADWFAARAAGQPW